MPAIGNSMTMGTGALLSYQLFPASSSTSNRTRSPGPTRSSYASTRRANPAAALRSLQRINDTMNKGARRRTAGGVVEVLRPAEIVNYRSMGTTPALLGATLAVGAVAALALTLIASVRRRRRELALLKTLGFTRRQLAAVVAWQSTIAVGIGVIIGVPLGIIIGRALWDLFARAIHAVPHPTVPHSHDHAHRDRRARARQPRRRDTRPASRAHAHRGAAPRRVGRHPANSVQSPSQQPMIAAAMLIATSDRVISRARTAGGSLARRRAAPCSPCARRRRRSSGPTRPGRGP